MFGRLLPSFRSLPAKERRSFNACYCNLCGTLSHIFGLRARWLLVNDVVTLGWLTEPSAPAHPFTTHNCLKGGARLANGISRIPEVSRFLAAMSAYALQTKVDDDLADKPGWKTRLLKASFDRVFARTRQELESTGFPVAELDHIIDGQHSFEESGSDDFVAAAATTSQAYGLVTSHAMTLQNDPVQCRTAKSMGEALGLCVYLLDAVRDFRADRGRSYNPLQAACGGQGDSLPDELRSAVIAIVKEKLRQVSEMLSDSQERLKLAWSSICERIAQDFGFASRDVVLYSCVCCVPCGDGAVAVDDKGCESLASGCACACCCIAIAMYCNRG